MGIIPEFGKGMVSSQVLAYRERIDKAAIFLLSYLGEKLAKYAKDHHNYTDQTGNLTNSIAYAVARGNEIVAIGGSDQPGEGAENAGMVLKEYVSTLTHSYSLIIVAGMNYAAYVEAKGYNVILPAELLAKSEFPDVMRKLQVAARKRTKEEFGIEL